MTLVVLNLKTVLILFTILIEITGVTLGITVDLRIGVKGVGC